MPTRINAKRITELGLRYVVRPEVKEALLGGSSVRRSPIAGLLATPTEALSFARCNGMNQAELEAMIDRSSQKGAWFLFRDNISPEWAEGLSTLMPEILTEIEHDLHQYYSLPSFGLRAFHHIFISGKSPFYSTGAGGAQFLSGIFSMGYVHPLLSFGLCFSGLLTMVSPFFLERTTDAIWKYLEKRSASKLVKKFSRLARQMEMMNALASTGATGQSIPTQAPARTTDNKTAY